MQDDFTRSVLHFFFCCSELAELSSKRGKRKVGNIFR